MAPNPTGVLDALALNNENMTVNLVEKRIVKGWFGVQ